ncbi:hypothetical protein LEP1GSC016_0981 [Leptospira borgpetersenii serovar Hardjo-bovis str. Sponselee]|uniref:Uncharacterized protein n=6 Tax=Leptospira borgpetersenii TaxID=174 RepID=M3HMF8_LEPBO|nr:hypothetical protein LBBP_01266 [Leptospira borgpetersenii serovar Ballum]EKP14051.1 hypothetical protein LEP1GSC128_0467 [Leptospira borgpetersenii str. 200801926]EKQ93088.1 hypothetical protein LEP1GSC101_3533 [Leptospira borgpetersenii str. UI 09149]EKQ98431.1 hypothetical protein LEP1GSC121_3018 [Leptospira borgpetersenii serovar Castellonis str. 200801910]EMF98849.1 hypothetical protein LEP1GSC123_3182 [Leptospira borgpetersenii str. 200701203]EMJ77991.1 hypothetical protein LEP1GSC016
MRPNIFSCILFILKAKNSGMESKLSPFTEKDWILSQQTSWH